MRCSKLSGKGGFIRLLSVALILCVLFSAAGCAEKDERSFDLPEKMTYKFSQNIERVVTDDGWVYTFRYQYDYDDGMDSSRIPPYEFFAFNIRYKYTKDHKSTFGKYETSEAYGRDNRKVVQLLGMQLPAPSVEELLDMSADSVTFEELDGKMFFDMVHTALRGEPHPVGRWDIPNEAILQEPEYKDGCALQIGFATGMGRIDEMFIDVLYPAGDEKYDYVQLSDMVDSGKATKEQVELFETLTTIAKGMVRDDNLYFGVEEYRNKKIASLDLDRLYTFAYDIGNAQYGKYSDPSPEPVPPAEQDSPAE